MMKRTLLLSLMSIAVISLFAQTEVGRTTYDLTSNNSSYRRIVTNPAGEVAITYTRSLTYSEAAPDRGTGFNYRDAGGNWRDTDFTGTTFTRPDLDRTGWPNVGILRNGNEIVVSHFAGDALQFGGIQVLQRPFGSTGAFVGTELNSNSALGTFSDDATWPRFAISGDSIIVISAAQTGTIVNGVDGGMFMHRSLDAGATWVQSPIPFVNGSNFANVGGDTYAIDANDNGVVAIVVGRYNTFLIKSTDFGATWTTTQIVKTFDIDGNQNANNYSGIAGESCQRQDIFDESFSVIVDDNDEVHVWSGRLDYQKAGPNDEGSVFPFSEGLMYWNESMAEPMIIHATKFTVEDGAGCNPLYTAAVINDPEFTQFGMYRSSLVSQPSASYDGNGNLAVVYSRMRTAIINLADEVTNASDEGYFYKDVFMLTSSDNGQTWIGPINVSNQDTLECSFPGVPRKFYNDTVPVVWMQDELPGTALQPATGYTHPYVDNLIIYDEVSLSSIVTPADETCPTIQLLDENVNTLTISQGCNPDADDYLTLLVFDDVPQGPDTSMVRVIQGSITGSGTYDIYLEDAAGNISADTVQLIIDVIADVTPPTFTFIGPDTLQVIAGTTFTDPGLTYDDNGCFPTALPFETDNVNPTTGNSGFFTYEYLITDNATNTTTAIRYVEVINSDDDGPVITLIGGATDTVEVCTSYDELGATAFDLVDFVVPVTIDASAVDFNTVDSYIVTYTASDVTGNITNVTRTVYVVDNTAPLLTIEDDNDLITPADSYTEGGVNFTYVGTSFEAPSVSASDPNCSGQTVNVTIDDSNVDVNVEGNYLAIVTATDENGLSTSQNLTVRVGTEPTPDFTFIQTGTGLSLTNTSTGNPTRYRWDFGNGQTSQSPNSTPGVPTYQAGTTYEVCLTAENRFNDAPFNKTPKTECKTITFTSITNRNGLDALIEVYPNPTENLVNVEISDIKAERLNVEVTNILGTVIATQELNDVNNGTQVLTFDLTNNAAGVYFINISSENASTTKRVIVK